MAAAHSKLFEPLKLGKLELQHRIAMAPLTRFRAGDDHVLLPFVKEYYAQRAAVPGTLLISEGTAISLRGSGYPNIPAIYTPEHIAAWREVTDAVHAKGCYIYCQLAAIGRVADPKLMASLHVPIVSSSTVAFGHGVNNDDDSAPVPKELTDGEIKELIGDFAQAARNSIEAGFDGVEAHFANGYLPDQFLQDTCNHRSDGWGGSVEKRARFALEVAKALCDAIGSDRVGARLSPFSDFQGMHMEDPYPQFTYVVGELKKLDMAYLHLIEARVSGSKDSAEASEKINPFIDEWTKDGNEAPVLLAGGFKLDNAQAAVDEEYKDKNVVIIFGRYFISNPDLVFRLKNGVELKGYNRKMFYNAKEIHGYTDYLYSKEYMEMVTMQEKA